MIQGDDEVVAALKQAHAELAAQWEADLMLTADERAQGKANFSDEWLADRAIYLNVLYEANLSDTDDATSFDGDTWTITNASTSAGELPSDMAAASNDCLWKESA